MDKLGVKRLYNTLITGLKADGVEYGYGECCVRCCYPMGVDDDSTFWLQPQLKDKPNRLPCSCALLMEAHIRFKLANPVWFCDEIIINSFAYNYFYSSFYINSLSFESLGFSFLQRYKLKRLINSFFKKSKEEYKITKFRKTATLS